MQILCKSQQKVYNTFADELSDYIQIQKARGIAQKPSVLPAGATQKDSDWEREGKVSPERDVAQLHKPSLNFPPRYNPPHPSRYNLSQGWCPSYPGHRWPPQGLLHSGSPPVFPGPASPLFSGHFLTRKRPRKPPSSPSHETPSSSDSSSYSSSSSSSSSSSDSGDSKYHHREKRRIRKSRRLRDKRTKEEDSDKEDKRRKRRRRERHKELDEGGRGESGGSEEERTRKGSKGHSRNKSREKKACMDLEAAGEENWKQEEVIHDKTQVEVNVEQRDSEQDEPGRAKIKREKKKGKEDTRTEEEKLWDDSILGF